MALEVDAHGRLRIHSDALPLAASPAEVEAFGDRVVEQLGKMLHSCALDVAEAEPDGATLTDTGHGFSLTRERVRQIQNGALRHAAAELRRLGADAAGHATSGAPLPELGDLGTAYGCGLDGGDLDDGGDL